MRNFMKKRLFALLATIVMISSCQGPDGDLPIHHDTVFLQDYSIKFYPSESSPEWLKAYTDNDGKVQLLASGSGLYRLYAGQLLHPGSIVQDHSYRFLREKAIVDMAICGKQFVYLDKDAVFSNAWSGRLHVKHQLDSPRHFAGNEKQFFLVTDGAAIHYIGGEEIVWKGKVGEGKILQVRSIADDEDSFLLLTSSALYRFYGDIQKLEKIIEGNGLTAFDFDLATGEIILGTSDGYLVYDLQSGTQRGDLNQKLPWTEITAVERIGDKWWFGTSKGAFAVSKSGQIDYYASERWLPNDHVQQISRGVGDDVLVLTKGGLAKIRFQPMTLHEKAQYFEKQVRDRHIRNGFNATLSGLLNGDLQGGYMADSDNDGLWTSLYLASQAFRFAVTNEAEALENCIESLDAMERLYDINPVPGFPARSFERRGTRDVLSDPDRWQLAEHPEWFWKATTSSDEAIGHIFAFGVIAEIVDHQPTKDKAIRLIDTLMGHIVQNDLYLVDYDGQPTTWGRWNPEYVNALPVSVGDRKLNSSNIVSMLQTAYHFTGKQVYKDKAFELMEEQGYLENLMRPIREIGKAPESADEYSAMLSDRWNHSDDEMYFVGYWGLYRYAFNDTLKMKYKEAILDHWEAERPEKEGAWNIFTAITGVPDFDLQEAVWFLQEYPLDLIQWTVTNSHRKDITPIPMNFRNQTIAVVLPPDELKISRHNANRFILDGGNHGSSENSAGDIWLFPYWMGRYLGVIGDAAR